MKIVGTDRLYATKEESLELNEKLNHEWNPEDGKCPYCGGGNCKHWTGLGWTKK